MSLRSVNFGRDTRVAVDKYLALGFQALLITTVIFLFVPFTPGMPTGNLDPSWAYGMNQAMAQGLVIGRDIIFTYGPYASIYTRMYHPAIDHLMFYGSVYFALSYAFVLFLVVRKCSWLLMGAFWLFLVYAIREPDTLFFSYPLLVGIWCCNADKLLSRREGGSYLPTVILILLFLPFGLLPLIKASFLLPCALATALIAGLFTLDRRWSHAATVTVSPLVAAALFWSISGQALADISFYWSSMAPIVSGYTEAMALAGSDNEIYFYLAAAALLLIAILYGEHNSLRRKIFLLLLFSGYLFMAFKSAFVRHDFHALHAGTAIMLASFFFAFTVRSRLWLPVLAISTACWLYIDNNYTEIATESLVPARRQSIYMEALQGARDRLGTDDILISRFNAANDALAREASFPLFSGTTDIYSYNQSLLIASGNAWNPRPVFQSFSAYTPLLAQINKEHLLGAKAPDNIIFRVEPIDGHLPATEDGASWPALLSHYELVGRENGFLYLRRTAREPPSGDQDPIGSGVFTFGEAVPVPAVNAPVFVNVMIEPSILGRMAALLYKPSELRVTLLLENGSMRTYRLVSGMARSGFVISPLVASTEQFGLLYDGAFAEGHLVTSFSIEPLHRAFDWHRTFAVTFRKVALNPRGD